MPEVTRRQGVPRGVRFHAAFTRQLARKGLETEIAPPLDHRQRRLVARNAAEAIRAQRISDRFQSQVVRPGKIHDTLDLDGDIAHLGYHRTIRTRFAGRQGDSRKETTRVCVYGHEEGVRRYLPLEADFPQAISQAGGFRDHEMIDPILEPRSGFMFVNQGFGPRPALPVEGDWRGRLGGYRHGGSPLIRRYRGAVGSAVRRVIAFTRVPGPIL